MVPTATATLGVKGHRPVVGTWDCKDLLYVFAVVNLVSSAIHSNTLESPKDAKKKTGESKTRRLQEKFAQHLRHVGRIYPKDKHKEVVLLIDNAPWHAGKPVDEALAENPHLNADFHGAKRPHTGARSCALKPGFSFGPCEGVSLSGGPRAGNCWPGLRSALPPPVGPRAGVIALLSPLFPVARRPGSL